MKTEIKQSITITTAEVTIIFKDGDDNFITKKVVSFSVPDWVSDQMESAVATIDVMKHEYSLSNTTIRSAATDGTLILMD